MFCVNLLSWTFAYFVSGVGREGDGSPHERVQGGAPARGALVAYGHRRHRTVVGLRRLWSRRLSGVEASRRLSGVEASLRESEWFVFGIGHSLVPVIYATLCILLYTTFRKPNI